MVLTKFLTKGVGVRIEDLILKTQQRVRILRAFRGASWGLLAGLLTSALYLLSNAAGWVPEVPTWWWLIINAGIAAIGALVGYMIPVNVNRMLYEMDQQLDTEEVMITLHHLKEHHHDHDFLPILEQQFNQLKVQPERVYKLNVNDGKRGGGIAVLLGLTVLFWWLEPGIVPVAAFSGSSLSPEEVARALEKLDEQDVPEALRNKLEEFENVLNEISGERPEDSSQIKQGEADEDNNLIQLFDGLNQAQNDALSLDDLSTYGLSEEEMEELRRQQREQLEQLQQQMKNFMAGLPQEGQEGQQGAEGAEGQQVPQELKDLIDQMPDDNPIKEELQKALDEQNQQGGQERLQAVLEQLNEEIDQRLGADQALEELRDSIDEWVQNELNSDEGQGEPESSDENAQESEDGSESQEGNEGEGDPSGQGQGQTSGNEPAGGSEPGEGQGGRDANGLGGGDEAGTGGSGGRDPNSLKPDWDPDYKNADIPQTMLPAAAIEQWLSRGIPVETSQEQGQAAQFRLSYDQVEALLDVRDLSPELRDIVRLYFLQIIGQLNQESQPSPETTDSPDTP